VTTWSPLLRRSWMVRRASPECRDSRQTASPTIGASRATAEWRERNPSATYKPYWSRTERSARDCRNGKVSFPWLGMRSRDASGLFRCILLNRSNAVVLHRFLGLGRPTGFCHISLRLSSEAVTLNDIPDAHRPELPSGREKWFLFPRIRSVLY